MEALPLVCPACLASAHTERRLDAGRRCGRCGQVYPEVDGVPVLLADAKERETLARGDSGDSRSAFYQREEGFLREAPRSEEQLRSALSLAQGAKGLVLEIGSANGAFQGLGGEDYAALDYSLSLLRAHLSGRKRVCASAEAIPLESASCRFVFTVACLEHVPRPDLAFQEIDRVLAPGGVAYVSPAWHCRDWAAEGLPVRPYRDLDLKQRLRKAAIPVRNSVPWRAASQLPWRMYRRAITALSGAPSRLAYRPLEANYETFWMSDSDACSSIDSHEGVLFFRSRGYEILAPAGGPLRQVLFRAGPVIARKPAG